MYKESIVAQIKEIKIRFNGRLALTHNGKFHADEVFAIALLSAIVPDLKTFRSRDPGVLAAMREAGAYIVDVGMINDGVQNFDHHQNEGGGVRPQTSGAAGCPYASFGLVWQKFGALYIINTVFKPKFNQQNNYSTADVDKIWEAVDSGLVSQVDARDTGSMSLKASVGETVRQTMFIDLSAVIALLNDPEHTQTTSGSSCCQFSFAVRVASKLLKSCVVSAAKEVRDAQVLTQALSVAGRSPTVLVCEHQVNPPFKWLEDEAPSVLFLVYPNDEEPGCWLIAGVRGSKPGAIPRCKLDFPRVWVGLPQRESSVITGVESVTFIRSFIAGTRSKDDALKLAHRAVTTQR